MANITTRKTGHLQEACRPQFRITLTQTVHGIRKSQAVRKIEPASITAIRLVDIFKMRKIKCQHVLGIHCQQTAIEFLRWSAAVFCRQSHGFGWIKADISLERW